MESRLALLCGSRRAFHLCLTSHDVRTWARPSKGSLHSEEYHRTEVNFVLSSRAHIPRIAELDQLLSAESLLCQASCAVDEIRNVVSASPNTRDYLVGYVVRGGGRQRLCFTGYSITAFRLSSLRCSARRVAPFLSHGPGALRHARKPPVRRSSCHMYILVRMSGVGHAYSTNLDFSTMPALWYGLPRRSVPRALLITACALVTLYWVSSTTVKARLATFDALANQNLKLDSSKHYSFNEEQIGFWRSLHELLVQHAPGCSPPEQTAQPSPDAGFGNADWERPELLSMPKENVERMRNAHISFVAGMRWNTPRLVYKPGTRGIVTTAGGSYFPGFVLSLRMLRRTGSILPVEVFVASNDEYEPYICEEVLPPLNATCVVLADIMDAVPQATPIEHFQYKIFSILFSSFEEILFLDSDDFPVHDPIELFTSEPFLSTGLVTWPDFWHSTASSFYFQISSQRDPSVMERATSEAGQLLYSKKRHEHSLLLAAYYNYYGPHYYFRLLSQGGEGEGDKETFINAATALREPFFATSENVHGIGGGREDGSNGGWAMVQYDPVVNYASKGKNDSETESKRPFFLHANVPKMNPGSIFNLDRSPTKDANDNYARMWKYDAHIMAVFGFDLECQMWEEMKWIGCELEDKFKDWQGREGICTNVTQYWNDVCG